MIQNCKQIKKIFRFLLRLITLFIWKGKKPCEEPCCSKVNRVPIETVVPKKPKKKSSIKKKKKKVIIRKKKRGRKKNAI